jgi:vacuolar-type H+-ATPase subunit I/STV1
MFAHCVTASLALERERIDAVIDNCSLERESSLSREQAWRCSSDVPPYPCGLCSEMHSSSSSLKKSSNEESRRLNQLYLTLEKALSESKNQVNCHDAVSECYGENISVFASSNHDSSKNDGDDDALEMLASLVSERLKRINESVRDSFRLFLEQNDLASKLYRFERAVDECEESARMAKLSEEKDKLSARIAAENVTLPEGITVESIMRYQAYRSKEEEKQKILAEISSVESENKAIEENIAEKETMLQSYLEDIDKRKEQMKKSANIHTFS